MIRLAVTAATAAVVGLPLALMMTRRIGSSDLADWLIPTVRRVTDACGTRRMSVSTSQYQSIPFPD
jgi:hypothetical protein